MQFAQIAIDLLMYPANGEFTKVGLYSPVFGSHADLVFPHPDTALGRFLDSKLNALVNHRARSPHGHATVAKGRVRGEKAPAVVRAVISKPPAWLFYIARVIG